MNLVLFSEINWDAVGAVAEAIGAAGAIGALIFVGVQIRHAREMQRVDAHKDTALQLTSELKTLWNERWVPTIRALSSGQRPMLRGDEREVRYMLNWVNWIGSLYRTKVIPEDNVLLDEQSIGPALRQLVEIGRPLIKQDTWAHGPGWWMDLQPIAARLNIPWLQTLLDNKNDAFVSTAPLVHTASDMDEASEEYGPGFLASLKQRFPYEDTQLHAGGWRSTDWMMRRLRIGPNDRLLDVCCGEGYSAIWIARVTGCSIVGVDKDKEAIRAARREAELVGMAGRCHFHAVDLLHESIPVEDSSFSLAIGQDPDGLASESSDPAFEEVYRCLRPDGRFFFHHWVPGPDAPAALASAFDESCAASGYHSHRRCNADRYFEQMRRAGFDRVYSTDLSLLYREFHEEIIARTERDFLRDSTWTRAWLELAQQHPLGVGIGGRAPKLASAGSR